MKSICVFFVITISLFNWILCDTGDSYLAALRKSKDVDTLSSDNVHSSRSDFQPSSHYQDNTVAAPSNEIFEYFHHKQPKNHNYGPPPPPPHQPTLGYEHHTKPIYGPPTIPPPPVHHQIFYGPPISQPIHYPVSATANGGWNVPREENWLLNKLNFKMDFFTIGKILLKLIIFKKIVKFIALICLLLFLPKLQTPTTTTTSDEQDIIEARQFSAKYNLNNRINEVTQFALTAMDAFSKKYPNECHSQIDISCRLSKMIDTVDEKYPYQKIIKLYLPESETEQISNQIEATDD